MNIRKLSLKDDHTDYVIHYPYPCQSLPPIGFDIPDEGCQCVSIDPAIKNFALRIEKRYRTGYIETIRFIKVDFSKYGEVSEKKGTTTVDPRILEAATNLLLELLPVFYETRIVGIERQPGINYKSTRMFQHLLTFFRLFVPTFKYYCVVMDISPKLKGKVFGAGKKDHNELKQWGIQKACEILTWRNDKIGLQIILDHKGKSKTKADDLADTVIQMEALFITLGGIYTKPPVELLIAPTLEHEDQTAFISGETNKNSSLELVIINK